MHSSPTNVCWNEKPLPFVDYRPIRGRFLVLGKLAFCIAFFRNMWLAVHNTISQRWLISLNSGQTAIEQKWFFFSADVSRGGTCDEALKMSAWEDRSKLVLNNIFTVNLPLVDTKKVNSGIKLQIATHLISEWLFSHRMTAFSYNKVDKLV